jgi:hypothetical protein
MATSNTRTDISIDSEGTVYRNVGGNLVRVSWVLLNGNRRHNKGADGINTQAIEIAVGELIEQWVNQTPEPVKGMGVTFNCGSDRYAYTIIEVLTPKTLVVQQDKIVRDPETDDLKAVRDENGTVKTITFRKNGCWYEQGGKMGRGLTFTVGKRRYEMDPGF